MRFSVDPWDPSYGAPVDDAAPADSSATVNTAVERPPGEWSPVRGGHADRGEPVVFVDGVRRVEARVWIEDGSGAIGLAASWAAGAVRCDGRAEVVATEVRRGVFAASAGLEPVVTTAGTFAAAATASGSPEVLSLALQERLGRLEVELAEQVRREPPALLVVDGPLRGRQHLASAIGMIKAQHVRYLPEPLDAVLDALAPGERTPLFTIGTTWSRHSWYLRLPGSPTARTGLVRCECSADLAPPEAALLAERSAALLPRYASSRHRDPRAPQNLAPIAGLERRLRHLLGDALVVRRALQRSAA